MSGFETARVLAECAGLFLNLLAPPTGEEPSPRLNREKIEKRFRRGWGPEGK